MDDLIPDYLEQNFTQEMSYELLRTLNVFDHFNYKGITEKVANKIMDVHNQDKNETNDLILLDFRDGQDHIFRAHAMTINPDATIEHRTELLISLALLMRLEDYEPILSVLYSQESDMEILVSILSDICMLDEVQLYDLIVDFDPEFLVTLKKYAEGKTSKEDEEDLGRERVSIINNLKIFEQLYGADNLGVQAVKAGLLVGARFNSYFSYIKDAVVVDNSPELTAKNFLSILLVSSNGNNAPLITYKKYVDKFIDSLDMVQKVEPFIVKMIGEMENYKRAKHEETRVSQVSGQSKQIS